MRDSRAAVARGETIPDEDVRAWLEAREQLRAKIRRGGELYDGEAVFEEIRQLSSRRRAEPRK